MSKQEEALKRIKNNENVSIIGGAGVGKSYTIKKIQDRNTLLCAPTAIAALNIGGMTVHKAFGLPLTICDPSHIYNVSRKVKELFEIGSPIKRIIIDEGFMLRRDQFELINAKLQHIRGNKLPFGGIPTMISGDPFQIEPVVTSHEANYFNTVYDSPFIFDSSMYNFKTLLLTKVYRQSDERQIKLLNSIRLKDKHSKLALSLIYKESKPYVPNDKVTHLCCFKKNASEYNEYYFNKLSSRQHNYKASLWSVSGKDLWKDSPVPHEVKYKEGCRVIFKVNNEEHGYFNGEKGTVVDCKPSHLKVLKDNGKTLIVERYRWEKFDYVAMGTELQKTVTATFEQFPLALAYAQSIHSCQGTTMEDVAIDFGRGCFAHGMAYMALSRATNLKNISFVNEPKYSDVICNDKVKQFYRSIEK